MSLIKNYRMLVDTPAFMHYTLPSLGWSDRDNLYLKLTPEEDLAYTTMVPLSSFHLHFGDDGIQCPRRRYRVYFGNRDGS
jgi:hypothetical protein